jgi:plastocyanin domain-containing protein
MIESPVRTGRWKGMKHMTLQRTLQVVTLTLIAALSMACDEHADHASSSAEGAAAPATAGADAPIAVEVSNKGYDPSRVQAKAGQPLTLVFTRTTDQGCGDELVIADHDIQRDLPLNQPVEVTFTPNTAGEITFTCGMGMYDGKVVVK